MTATINRAATSGVTQIAGVSVPSRQETLDRARAQGLKVIAALPYLYPRALLRAHGFHATEIWAPAQVAADSGARHFQAYACSIVVKGAAFLLDGGFRQVDAVLVPHGCDALQGLGSVLHDFVGERPPILTLYPPRARRSVDAAYLLAELKELGKKLTAISGRIPSDQDWQEALAAEEAADAALEQLYRIREDLALSDRQFYEVVRLREYLLPEDFVTVTGQLPRGPRIKPRGAVPLLLSGIVADPLEVFDVIAGAGGYVAADDLSTGTRRILPRSEKTSPWERTVDRLMRGPADPTRTDPMPARAERLRALIAGSGARGLLVFDPTFCEPEQFYLPALRQSMQELGLPMLFVEHEAVPALGGQLISRIEAFVETLS